MLKRQRTLIILLTVLLIASLALLATQFIKNSVRTSGEVTLKSGSNGAVVKSWNFSPENALPGDSESQEYTLGLSLQKDGDLLFRPSVSSEGKSCAAALLLRVENTENGNVLCDGRVSELDGQSFSEAFTRSDKRVTYQITLTIDPSAGNEYQGTECKLDFHWSLGTDSAKEGDGK